MARERSARFRSTAGPSHGAQLCWLRDSQKDGESRAEMAIRLASFRTCEYRSIILRLKWPASAMMVASDAWPSAILLTNVCRRSCQRQATPALVRAAVYATFQEPMATSGRME